MCADVSHLFSVSIFSLSYGLLADGRTGVNKRIVFLKEGRRNKAYER